MGDRLNGKSGMTLTEERLRTWLDTNQVARERMCLGILSLQPGYSHLKPRRPKGGPDGGRDIEAVFRDEIVVWGAVHFQNAVSDSPEDKKNAKMKFKSDLHRALEEKDKLEGFVFFTNVDFTPAEVSELKALARQKGLKHVEIFHRERLRLCLDSTAGFALRFQHLDISLSDAEQKSFFAAYGERLHEIITQGFDEFSKQFQYLIFLNESQKPLHQMRLIVTLKQTLAAKDFQLIRALVELDRLEHPTPAALCLAVQGKSEAAQIRSEAVQCRSENLGAVISKAWSNPPEKEPIRTTRDFCRSLDQINGLFMLRDYGPFRSIADMDQCHVFLYMAEQSIDQVRKITLFADDNQLFDVEISDLVIRKGNAPATLAEDKETTQWVSLSLKGDSPEKWPTKLWQLYFADCVPKRVPQSRHWEPDGLIFSMNFSGNVPKSSL